MKVIGVEYGRVSLLVDLIELGTRRGIYLPEAAALVQGRYMFTHAPTLPPEDQQKQSYKFEHGRIAAGDRQYTISSFEIHPHGLVAQGTDTDAAEEFFDDFLKFGTEHLAMKMPEREPAKIFLSSVIIEFDGEANKFLTKWKDISKLLGTQLDKSYSVKAQPQLSRVTIQPDPQDLPPRLSVLINDFTIERRVHAPYKNERFISFAPFRTDEHITLLEKIEKLVLA